MKLTGLTPNLITNQIDRSVAFYRDVLGFSVVMTVPDAAPFVFVWLKRDEVNLFLNEAHGVAEEQPAVAWEVGKSGVSMFIHIEGVAEFWEQVKGRAPVIMALKDQWYGQTEFSVTDPDGYVITFAERKE